MRKSQAQKALDNLDNIAEIDLSSVANYVGISTATQYQVKRLDDLRPLIRERLQQLVNGEMFTWSD